MDIIFLRGLQIETVIGIYDWERKIKQLVVVDLEMGVDIRPAACTDSIDETLDYKAVSKRVIAFVEESRFLLVETLTEHLATVVMQEFHVPWIRVTVNKKGAVRGATDVGITIERGEKSTDG